MEIISYLLIALTLAMTAQAQPRVTVRQQSYPAPLPATEENVEWQRDIYREIDLMDDANAGLFSPQIPDRHTKGLFTTLFRLVMEGKVPAYEHGMDGNEVFNEITRISLRNILDDYHIPYSAENGKVTVEDEDVPAQEVKMYFLKEGIYYDLTNSSYRTRVLALCPVMIMEDEFSDEPTRYPMFWVEYKDLQPYLVDITILPDARNTALWMPMQDYFTLNRYRGSIYKVYNIHGKTLRQYCETDSAMKVEQQRIEKDIKHVKDATFDTFLPPARAAKKRMEGMPAKQPSGKPVPKKNGAANNDDSDKQ